MYVDMGVSCVLNLSYMTCWRVKNQQKRKRTREKWDSRLILTLYVSDWSLPSSPWISTTLFLLCPFSLPSFLLAFLSFGFAVLENQLRPLHLLGKCWADKLHPSLSGTTLKASVIHSFICLPLFIYMKIQKRELIVGQCITQAFFLLKINSIRFNQKKGISSIL